MCRGKGKKEVKMQLSPKEIEKIRKDLAKVDALKKALGLKKETDNPSEPSTSDFSILVYLQLGSLSGKIWWLLGLCSIITALLITILVTVLG